MPLVSTTLGEATRTLNQLIDRELSEVETRQHRYFLCQKSPKMVNSLKFKLHELEGQQDYIP